MSATTAPEKAVKVESKVEGEIYTHRVLWRTARLQADRGGAGHEGAFFSRLAAIAMAFATVEAYANFLLQILDAERYEKERKAFNGVTHKIAEVMRMVGLQLDPRQRPYGTVLSIKDTRDRIMHAKPEVYSDTTHHTAADEPPSMTEGELQTLTAVERVADAMVDVEQFCEALHGCAIGCAKEDDAKRLRLENSALTGSFQVQTTTSTVVPVLPAKRT